MTETTASPWLPGAAQRLERDERRRPVPVVVARLGFSFRQRVRLEKTGAVALFFLTGPVRRSGMVEVRARGALEPVSSVGATE
jgi:hypothetical protein